MKSFNENRSQDDPIPMLWDFTDDVLEAEQRREHDEVKSGQAENVVPSFTTVFPPQDVPSRPTGRITVLH